MRRFIAVCCIASASLAALDAALGAAPEFPVKSIRVVTSGAGGGNDFIARLIAPGLTANLGQQVIVDNRGGLIAAQVVSKAARDGYTLLVASNSMWIGPLLRETPYDPVADFAAVSMTTRAPLILAVHPSVAATSVKELIALAKAKPGALNYASTTPGGPSHISMELLKSIASVNIVRISYKGGGAALTGLLSGEVQMTIDGGSQLSPHVKSGKVRALGVTTAEPSPLAPGLPAIALSGLPGFEAAQLSGVLAPAKTPRPITNRLNQEIARVIVQADVKEKFFNSGVEASTSSPEQFAAAVRSEINRLGKVIKETGIRAD